MSPLDIRVVDNRAYVVINFAPESDLQQALDALKTMRRSQVCERLGVNSPAADENVWQALSPVDADNEVHKDLYPIVRRILAGGDHDSGQDPIEHPASKSKFPGWPPFRLRSGTLCQEYMIPLQPRARERLAATAPAYAQAGMLPLQLRDVRVHLLGTGIGFLYFELEFTNPFQGSDLGVPAEVLIEGVGALCRAKDRDQRLRAVNLQTRVALEPIEIGTRVRRRPEQQHCVSQCREGEDAGDIGIALRDIPAESQGPIAFTHPQGEHSLLGLADALLGHHRPGAALKPLEAGHDHQRLFSYCAAQLPAEAIATECDALAYRLAHKFTIDYALTSAGMEPALVRPFKNIAHAMATQGGAVVTAGTEVEFLRHYIGQAVARTYLPLALLAHHEYLRLRALTHADLNHKDLGHYEQQLLDLQHDLVDFRINYRFSHVSDLAHHNVIFQQWRKALALDYVLDELSRDAAEGERVLRTLREARVSAEREKAKEREHRHRFLFHALSALGVFFVLNEVIELLSRVFVLRPADAIKVVEKAIELLDKPRQAPDFTKALKALKCALAYVVDRLHTIHLLEFWAFVGAVLVVLYALWFIYKYRKSPVEDD